MDVFARTFLPAAAENGLAVQTATRHMPVFRGCVGAGDTPILVARCIRQGHPVQGEHLLLLTHRRLVVTRETRMLHRLRLHLNTELRHLSGVTWNPDPRRMAVELSATAIDGIRERLLIRAQQPRQVWQLDALLRRAFQHGLGEHREPLAAITGDRWTTTPPDPIYRPGGLV